jgi:hypothetical protein
MVQPDPVALDLRGVPRFTYLAGCDGTGKTTQARLLVNCLQQHGVASRRLWLRFPFCLSLPLLAYARLRGFSYYEESNVAHHGYWDFERSRLLRSVFPWALLADTCLACLWHVFLPLWRGRTIVCERFVLDILVDLSLAFKDPGFHRIRPGSLYLRLLPNQAAVIVLDLDGETIRLRRPDLVSDRRLEARLRAYSQLAAELQFPFLSSAPPVLPVHRSILRAIQDNAPPPGEPGYGHLQSPALRNMFRFPALALASHWLFQGFFCMGWGERAFKLALDLLLTLGLGAYLRLVFPWPSALLAGFLTAHTLNFLFNGHLWGALKHYGVISLSREEFTNYSNGLIERADCEPAIAGVRVSGSLAQGTWTPASDFDARLVPARGVRNLYRACWFLLKERSRALLARFPLDLYLERAIVIESETQDFAGTRQIPPSSFPK